MNAWILTERKVATSKPRAMTDVSRLAQVRFWGALGGLAGSMLAVVFGSLLTAASWVTAEAGVKHWLASAGTLLLCLTIPLILLGAWCLDGLEKAEMQDRPQATSGDEDAQ
jgi:hypothetical protein